MKFEVWTPVTVKVTVLLDVSPCSLVEIYHFLDGSVPTYLENPGGGYILPFRTPEGENKSNILHFSYNYITYTVFITNLRAP